MRAPLGMLMILLGAVMGYLVLTGKLPTTTNLLSGTPTPGSPTDSQINSRYRNQNGPTGSSSPTPNGGIGGPAPIGANGGGPYYGTGDHSSSMGLPTMQNLQDMNASSGVY